MKRTTDDEDEAMLALERIMAGLHKLRWLILSGDIICFILGTVFGVWLCGTFMVGK